MKKLFLVVGFILCNLTIVNAQISSGDILLEGNLNISKSSTERVFIFLNAPSQKVEVKTITINIVPTLNFFLNKSTSIFAGLGYEKRSSEDVRYTGVFETPKVVTNSLITELGARLYHNITDNVYFFNSLRSYSQYGKTKHDATSNAQESNNFDTSLSLNHGISINISEKFLLSTSFQSLFINYSKINYTNLDVNSETITYGINTNLNSLRLSLSYKF